MDGFEWDDAKAEANWVKHGVTFAKAALAYLRGPTTNEITTVDGEYRWKSVCGIGDDPITIISTPRTAAIRIISARKASRRERRKHRQILGR